MIVKYLPGSIIPNRPSRIHMKPEGKRDEVTLESIVKDFPDNLFGFGRHGETRKVLHVEIECEKEPS